MINKTCILLSCVALSLVVGCNKAGTREEPVPALEPLVFSGTNVVTKAVFSDGLVDGALEWSDYDNLGVYSCQAEYPHVLAHQGFAALSSKAGEDAVFTSSTSRSTWAGSFENLTLCAYYPQMAAPQANYNAGYVDLNVPAIQNGEFGRYHICYDDVNITKLALEGGAAVDFEFNPVTSMLRVRPVVADASSADRIYVKQLVVNIAGGKKLAGDCRMPIPGGTLAVSGGGSSSTVSVVLPAPIAITKTASENPFIDVVILPEHANNAVLSFYVVATNGTKFTMTGKLAPAQFQPGVRYNIDRPVLVYLGDTPDGQYIDGGYGWAFTETDEDGAYTDGGQAW